jgi:4-diphosphocytidyl-2-C-methyl-D-erythritol kinase
MLAVAWGDEVRVRLGGRPRPERVKVRGGAGTTPTGARNLMVRAARAWRAVDPTLPPLALEVHKRIPAGAGLGGGSSDAAAVLRALSRLRPGRADALALAAAVGSDVPFFVGGLAAAVASGRGERLGAAPPPPSAWRLLLVVPAARLATAAVYRRFDRLAASGVRGEAAHGDAPLGERTRAVSRLVATAAGADGAGSEHALGALAPLVGSDLWPAAVALRPELAEVRAALARAVGDGRPVGLTGSGSALYALVEDAGRAWAARRRLEGRGLALYVVRPLAPPEGRAP